jgi:hypothetical protein
MTAGRAGDAPNTCGVYVRSFGLFPDQTTPQGTAEYVQARQPKPRHSRDLLAARIRGNTPHRPVDPSWWTRCLTAEYVSPLRADAPSPSGSGSRTPPSPTFENGGGMAVLSLHGASLILDASDEDTTATIGFASNNCDEDYRLASERGAETLEVPEDRTWGVRAAYLRGPGGITFEIEQGISSSH